MVKLIQTEKLTQWMKIYKLYQRSFPKYERKPFWLIYFMKKKGKTDVWYIEKNSEFAGLAVTMNSGDFVLLDYFAVDDKKRGCGIGSKSLVKLQQKYAGKKFFLEIESVYEEANNLSERKRRKKFYLSNGMSEMGVMAEVYGVNMELLGYECEVDFAEYHSVYWDVYGEKRARFIKERGNIL